MPSNDNAQQLSVFPALAYKKTNASEMKSASMEKEARLKNQLLAYFHFPRPVDISDCKIYRYLITLLLIAKRQKLGETRKRGVGRTEVEFFNTLKSTTY